MEESFVFKDKGFNQEIDRLQKRYEDIKQKYYWFLIIRFFIFIFLITLISEFQNILKELKDSLIIESFNLG